MHTRPPAPPRARALYCYFSRIFNKVACGIAFSFTRSLTHTSPLPSQICSGRTDPLNREILQSSVKRKGSNCGENCEGSSAENCYRGIATPYHLPCILKYRHRFAARVLLLHTMNEFSPKCGFKYCNSGYASDLESWNLIHEEDYWTPSRIPPVPYHHNGEYSTTDGRLDDVQECFRA